MLDQKNTNTNTAEEEIIRGSDPFVSGQEGDPQEAKESSGNKKRHLKERITSGLLKTKQLGVEKYRKQQEKLRAFEAERLSNEFLPAALEIAETPASPLGRFVIRGIFVILITAILWSTLGKVDEVAVARGKIAPDGRIKVVQPIEEGIITAIHIEEGQKVTQGQLLIELDSSIKQVDMEGLTKTKEATETEIKLLNMILDGENIEEKIKEYKLDLETQNNLILLAKYRDSDFEGQRNILELVSAQGKQQVSIRESELVRMQNELTMLQKREESLRILAHSKGEVEIALDAAKKQVEELTREENTAKQLYEAGGLSKNEWQQVRHRLELAQNLYEAEGSKAELEKINRKLNWENAKAEIQDKQNEIHLQEIRIQQERTKYDESVSNLDNLSIKKNETILDLLVQKEKFLLDIENQIAKINKSIELSSLRSPIGGTVHGLAANTVGGVVTLAQPIMTIVPDGTPLLVEASLQNKDVGFVHVGQEVEVKVDAFPYQRYGMVRGIVQSVSPDAFEDEKLGLVYRVKVSMEHPEVIVDGQKQRLSAGMSVSAEITTDRRRIISFFLEPFVKNIKESVTLR
ncbi:MAG: HlyD family type I secretion periplasmic adaptor subunit [Peptostreptococcaceae bacterium]|nr:HlyD family type I secretion periplasmic adaptor subunit [Peptostreptococcaceae bacterium]